MKLRIAQANAAVIDLIRIILILIQTIIIIQILVIVKRLLHGQFQRRFIIRGKQGISKR